MFISNYTHPKYENKKKKSQKHEVYLARVLCLAIDYALILLPIQRRKLLSGIVKILSALSNTVPIKSSFIFISVWYIFLL